MFGYLQTALSGQTAAFTLNITSFQSREPGRAVWLEGDRGDSGRCISRTNRELLRVDISNVLQR